MSTSSFLAQVATELPQLRITGVEPVADIGVMRAQVRLSPWLVAVVQAPAGQRYADLLAVFAPGAGWPLAAFPAGYVLLGYLDPQDLLAI